MSEAILREDWLQQVERAFEKLKAADVAEREEVYEVVLLDYGSEAEAELKAKLAAHDQAMQPKTRLSWRRELNGAKAALAATKAAPLRDVLDVAAKKEAATKPEVVGSSQEAVKVVDIGEASPKEASFFEPAAQPKAEPIKEVTRIGGAVGFQHTKSRAGIPASLENALHAIDVLKIDCRYDVFHDKIIVKGHVVGLRDDALNNLENVTLKVRQAVLQSFGFDPGPQYTFDALRVRCLDRVFDPVLDYLDRLKWDGAARLDSWLIDYCGAIDTKLNRAIGRKMLIAAVRRIRQPGCKFDYIIVLEADQGAGKSTLLKILAGEENFSDNEIIGLDKREQQEAVQGVWIYEIGELEGMYKSDVTKVKLFASKTVDMARPAYGRSRIDRPRRGIFVATTNDDAYLRDTTGNRRFWPVKIPKGRMIDLAAVTRDRDQLWAEAVAIEATRESLVIPEALWPDATAAQQARMELDPWENTLAPKLASLETKSKPLMDGCFVVAADNYGNSELRVSSDYLLTLLLGLPKERQNNNHTKRLASIMRGLGWTRPETTIRIGTKVCRGFVKPRMQKVTTLPSSLPQITFKRRV